MNAVYRKMNRYTIVLTPHALQSRTTKFSDIISVEDIVGVVDGVHHRMHPNRVSGTVVVIGSVDVAYIYMRRIFNDCRNREEIEVISLTCPELFKTHGYNENGESHMDTVWITPRSTMGA